MAAKSDFTQNNVSEVMLLGTPPKFQPETKGQMCPLMIKPLEWAPRCRAAGGRAGGPPRRAGAALLHPGKAEYCLSQPPGRQIGLPLSVWNKSQSRPRLHPPEGRMKARGGWSILVPVDRMGVRWWGGRWGLTFTAFLCTEGHSWGCGLHPSEGLNHRK